MALTTGGIRVSNFRMPKVVLLTFLHGRIGFFPGSDGGFRLLIYFILAVKFAAVYLIII